ncbi:hypothetical protein GFH30_09925 [Acinetobacter wanghuae]|uniref:DUF6160 domain-containing protein n=1 Tax=Acinetobacter wanghuae TaxID=2662362 RepID=A0A5Q0P3G9_9GAMM|nr:DUF6160 family protein [Acinetobacter wanghuae]MQW91422.1 hypothetical protein [Acinetobacter wanghuae]QGA11675.1 hypothetical protein GFH30_09925 [Acinetobacter wanghuae]
MRAIIKLNFLVACICAANQSYALQVMSDQTLSSVTGQDGISITHEMSRANIDQLNWVDYSENGKTPIKLGLHDVQISANAGNTSILSKIDFDVGRTEISESRDGVGIEFSASISPFVLAASQIMLCPSECIIERDISGEIRRDDKTGKIIYKNSSKPQNLGSLSISTTSPLEVYLKTKNGLFNQNDSAHLDFRLQNASISYGQNGQNLTLKDFNFNLSADGYMFIDPDNGIILETRDAGNFVELNRVKDNEFAGKTKPGVNIDLRYGEDGTQGNLIRLGASGALTNGKIMLNAKQEGASSFHVINGGVKSTIADNEGYDFTQGGGLHLGMSADFTRADKDKTTVSGKTPTTFELGHTGTGSYAIEFSNLTRLNVRTSEAEGAPLSTANAYINFGDIYINTVNTDNLGFAVNDQIKNILQLPDNKIIYNPSPTIDPQTMTLIAVRGMDFQAIARKARFISDNSLPENNAPEGTWGIGIPIYNLNANLGLFEKKYTNKLGNEKSGLGFDLAMSTDGYYYDSETGNSYTTSLLVLDGEKRTLKDSDGVPLKDTSGKVLQGEEVNYYAGLRNIDSYIKANGVIGFEDNGIYIKADNLLFAAKAEIAIGQLPGSLYNCGGECGKKIVPIDNFGRKDDVLASIAFKLDGDGKLFIIPGIESASATPDTNYLKLKANFQFTPLLADEKNDAENLGSYISISNEDSVNVSSINLNKMQGDVGAEARVRMKKDTAVLDSQVSFNRLGNESTIGKAFTAEVALSPSVGKMQKIGDIAFTGGSMRSTLGIKPR